MPVKYSITQELIESVLSKSVDNRDRNQLEKLLPWIRRSTSIFKRIPDGKHIFFLLVQFSFIQIL